MSSASQRVLSLPTHNVNMCVMQCIQLFINYRKTYCIESHEDWATQYRCVVLQGNAMCCEQSYMYVSVGSISLFFYAARSLKSKKWSCQTCTSKE